MKKYIRWCLFAFPCIALTSILMWVRWKQLHPSATNVDVYIRRTLAENQSGEIRSNYNQKSWPLSATQRQDIIANFWVDTDRVYTDSNGVDDIVFLLGQGQLILSDEWYGDAYIGLGRDEELRRYYLQPATSVYLRRWLARHPDIEEQIGYNENAHLH